MAATHTSFLTPHPNPFILPRLLLWLLQATLSSSLLISSSSLLSALCSLYLPYFVSNFLLCSHFRGKLRQSSHCVVPSEPRPEAGLNPLVLFPAFSPLMYPHPVGTGSELPLGVTSRMALGQCPPEASVFLALAPRWVSLWSLGVKLGS